MALQRNNIGTISPTSWQSLGIAGIASCVAQTVSGSSNVIDHELTVIINPGAVTPAAGVQINAYIYGSPDGTIWPSVATTDEVIDGTDKGSLAFSTYGQIGKLLGVIPIVVASQVHKSNPMSLVAALGSLPSKYVVVIQNATGVALASSGNSLNIQELYYN